MANSMNTSRIEKSRHRGWSPHISSERYRLAQPNRKVVGICVTSGDLGTHGMHPPRKRTPSDSKSQQQSTSVTCGLTWRSAPTRRIHITKRQHQSLTKRIRSFETSGDLGTSERLVTRRGITDAERQIRNASRFGYTEFAYAVQTMLSVLRNAVGEFT
jgi:hypothetical protein